jgi:hypothetical protein
VRWKFPGHEKIEMNAMRRPLTLTALAALIALPLIAGSTDASASCQSRKNTGTLLGGVGGALIGNSISHGGGGAVIGGLGGAVLGHEIAKGGCGPSRQTYYRHGSSPNRYATTDRPTQAPAPAVYYDQRGNPVTTTNYDSRR